MFNTYKKHRLDDSNRISNEYPNNCYMQKILEYEKASYDGIIDMIYILTMVKSYKRHKGIYSQLDKFKLTKNVKIIFNKGYKACKKQSCNKYKCGDIKIPPHDITHANNEILKDAMKNNYKIILVLEDDFILSDRINESSVIKNIRKIIDEYKHKELVLKLGCFPFITLPYNNKYRRVLLSSGAHAVLYNDNAIKKIVNNKLYSLDDLDFLINKNFFGRELMYKEPLIYQLVEESENMKHWDNWNGGLLNSGKLFFSLMKYLSINKQVEPGTSIIYKYHRIINYLLYLLLFMIIYNVYRRSY